MSWERPLATPDRRYDFVVAGGGIGGLATAIALANKDFAVAVLERNSEFSELGAGLQMGPNAFKVLDHLGVGEATRKSAVFIDRLILMDSLNGERICAVDVGDDFRDRFHNPYAVIHRADLLKDLLDAARDSSLIDLFSEAAVTRLRQSDQGVTVSTQRGVDVNGRGLVGADGLHSVVRATVLGDGSPRVSGHVTYRAVLPLQEMPEELRWNDMVIWCGPNTHVVHYPLHGWELFNLVVTCVVGHSDEAHNEPAMPNEVLPRFSELCEMPMRLVRTPREFRRWVLCDRPPVERWGDGRVTLLGDAAHPMLQYFAQGACMALEDAAYLAEAVHRQPDDIGAAFIAYELGRVNRTARLQLGSRMMGRLYHAADAERLARKRILGSWSQETFRDNLAWLYGYDVGEPGLEVAPHSFRPGPNRPLR